MGLKLKNKRTLNKYIVSYALHIERSLIIYLEYLVAQLENHAKLSAGYEDQTSNLKGSIGGVVLKDGRPISYSGFNEGNKEGNTVGKEFIESKFGEHANGYVVLVVAGMEYATYVENIHNLNVLKESELLMEREIPRILQKLKRKIR